MNRSTGETSGSFGAAVLNHAPLFLGMAYLIGLGLISWLTWKCNYGRPGAGRRITTALQKMSQGDLGWKITLRRGDELADVADSVTQASASLADRIVKLQMQTRQLTEIENYLIDSVDTHHIDPYTLKALRKLKICTSRLNADMEDFQISAIATDSSDSGASQSEMAAELQKI
jgi:methyl-accepting chemotaxis protein